MGKKESQSEKEEKKRKACSTDWSGCFFIVPASPLGSHIRPS